VITVVTFHVHSRAFLDQLSNCQLLREFLAPCVHHTRILISCYVVIHLKSDLNNFVWLDTGSLNVYNRQITRISTVDCLSFTRLNVSMLLSMQLTVSTKFQHHMLVRWWEDTHTTSHEDLSAY